MSVRLILRISVTAVPIWFYSSGNIDTDPAVVLSYFVGGWDTPDSPIFHDYIEWGLLITS